MRKLIFIFSILILCISCEKERDCNNNSNNTNNIGNNLPPQNCGSVTMDVDYLANESFNSNQYEVTCASGINKSNGTIYSIAIGFDFNCNTIVPGTSTSVLSPVRRIVLDYYPSLSIGTCFYDSYYCDFNGSNYFSTNFSSNDSIVVNLTNVDEINFLISGDFSIIDPTGNKPNIDVIFADVPVIINAK